MKRRFLVIGLLTLVSVASVGFYVGIGQYNPVKNAGLLSDISASQNATYIVNDYLADIAK